MSSNFTDASTTDQISQSAPVDQRGPMDLETARQVEDKKLTRRAALRKLGFGAGVAAFSLLGVDDLARLVGDRLARHSGDSQVAQAVAQEFQQAGIVLANPSGLPDPSGLDPDSKACYHKGTRDSCIACCDNNKARCIGNIDYNKRFPPINVGISGVPVISGIINKPIDCASPSGANSPACIPYDQDYVACQHTYSNCYQTGCDQLPLA